MKINKFKMQPSAKSFYASLKELNDTRSVAGKRHDLAFVLCGFILGVMSNRKKRASVHRFMKNNHDFLCKVTNFAAKTTISNPQLGRLLRTLNVKELNEVVYAHYGVEISELSDGEWVSVDGKDLRGSIDVRESSRGEVLVHGVRHSDKKIVAESFYQGDKESEKLAVREMLKQTGLESKSVTLDALHTDPTTLEQIAGHNGQYIVQVKENQKELTKDLGSKVKRLESFGGLKEVDKAHGRLEQRAYDFYNIEGCVFEKRWAPCRLSTLIVVNRYFEELKSGKIMSEQSFYISNVSIVENTQSKIENLAQGVRGHWTIENVNQIRDVSFKEDDIKMKRGNYAKAFAVCVSLAFACLNQIKPANFIATMEGFADDKGAFGGGLRQINFL